MSDFTLPTNIKQIGSIGDGLRIYVEDYVCTFLHQYAEAGGYGERLAFLVGRHLMIDGQPILFINGAIHGKHTSEHEGFLRFTEKSRDYAEAMLDEHFPMMEIVGWMQSQPSYGTYLNQHYASYHLRQFRKAYQVMFVLDPVERSNAFYAPDPDAMTPSERMAEVSGYFIYYEKNVSMHEYMLANKVTDYTAKSPTIIEKTPLVFASQESETREEPMTEGAFDDYDEEYPDFSSTSRIEPEEIIRRHQAEKAKRKAPVAEQRRALNLVASLCAVLFVVSFIIGARLIQSQDRINTMEQEIRMLNTGLRNVFAQLNTGELDPLAPAFAEHEAETQDNYTDLPTTDPTPNPEAENQETSDPTATQETGTHDEQTSANQDTQTPDSEAQTTQTEDTTTISNIAEGVATNVPQTYTIQYGDSLLGISMQFFNDANMIEEIMALNGIDDPNHIVAGRTIALPRP